MEFEATTAGGDSGGPVLVQLGGEWVIAVSSLEELASTAPMAISRGGLGPRSTVMTLRPGVESSAFLLLEHAALPMAPVFPCSMMNVILPVGLLRVQIPHALHHHALPLQLGPVALALNALSSPLQVVKMVVGSSTVSDLPAPTMVVPPVHAA